MNITIVDEGKKPFNVTLEKTPDLDRITLDPMVGLVDITDNNGRYDDYILTTITISLSQ